MYPLIAWESPKSQESVRLWGGSRRRINIRIGGMGNCLPGRWVFSEKLLPSQCLPRQKSLLWTPSQHQSRSFLYNLSLAPLILSHHGLLVSPCSWAGGSVFSTCLSHKPSSFSQAWGLSSLRLSFWLKTCTSNFQDSTLLFFVPHTP